MPTPLDVIADWPVPAASAAVIGRSGVLAAYGDGAREYRLASVTKPLVARAAQVAVEEGWSTWTPRRTARRHGPAPVGARVRLLHALCADPGRTR
jgi:CubicO group peptidase (beta-lactamase class C family)